MDHVTSVTQRRGGTAGTWDLTPSEPRSLVKLLGKVFGRGLLGEAKGLQGQYLSAIQEKARRVNVAHILQDVRQ